MIKTREIYASSNGDRWSVGVESDTGQVFVEHQANIPSGGDMTSLPSFRRTAPK